MPHARVIVGIGNPGTEYERTRHNIGFLVVRNIAQRFSSKWQSSSFVNGLTASVVLTPRDKRHLLIPLTFVNLSGRAVKKFLEKHIEP